MTSRNRRQSTNPAPIIEGEREEHDEENHPDADPQSMPSSRSTSSSDLESLSSDDSDVEIVSQTSTFNSVFVDYAFLQINAPVFSEFPPWLRFPYLYENYIVPSQQYVVTSGILDSSYAFGQYCLSLGGQAAQQVAQGSFAALENAFRITYEASTTYVVPQLLQFMNDVVDQQQQIRAAASVTRPTTSVATTVNTAPPTTTTTFAPSPPVGAYPVTPLQSTPRGTGVPPPPSYPPRYANNLPSTVATSSPSYTISNLPVTHAFPVAIPPSSAPQQQQYTVAEKAMETYYSEEPAIPSQPTIVTTESIVLQIEESVALNTVLVKNENVSFDSETLAALAIASPQEEEEKDASQVVSSSSAVDTAA